MRDTVISRFSNALPELLCNSIILYRLVPYLPVASILNLSAASKTLRALLRDAPETFRYLDLSAVKSAILPYAPIDGGGISWRSERMDESLTPEEFYSGPLRGILYHLGKHTVLSNVQTLILDGLSVPAELIQDIITEDRFRVRILSIRDVKHLNVGKLQHGLTYTLRPTRPQDSPRLKALYFFGPKQLASGSSTPVQSNSSEEGLANGIMSSIGAQIGAIWNQKPHRTLNVPIGLNEDVWYRPSGRRIKRQRDSSWANTLKTCEGLIAFDAVLCRGPRHHLPAVRNPGSKDEWLPPAIATIALGPQGCVKCGSSPEGPAVFGESPSHHLPLLSPPPLHSSSVKSAQKPIATPGSHLPALFARCDDCLRGRWCERCQKWWCEDCYNGLADGKRLTEVREIDLHSGTRPIPLQDGIKIHMGLCTEDCLVLEMMSGAGSFGMWG